MGLKFRKSFGAGPFKINISKSGVGYSFGTKGARITKSANGRTTATVGSGGLSYTTTLGKKKKHPGKKDVPRAKRTSATTKTSVKAEPMAPAKELTREEMADTWFLLLIIPRLLAVIFMAWVLRGAWPSLRCLWLGISILLAVPLKPWQRIISDKLYLPSWGKGLVGFALCIAGLFGHGNAKVALYILAALSILLAAFIAFVRCRMNDPSVSEEDEAICPAVPDTQLAQTPQPSPEEERELLRIFGVGERSYQLTRLKSKASDGTVRANNIAGCEVRQPITFTYDSNTNGYIVWCDGKEIGELPRTANNYCELASLKRLRGVIESVELDKVRVRIWFFSGKCD